MSQYGFLTMIVNFPRSVKSRIHTTMVYLTVAEIYHLKTFNTSMEVFIDNSFFQLCSLIFFSALKQITRDPNGNSFLLELGT